MAGPLISACAVALCRAYHGELHRARHEGVWSRMGIEPHRRAMARHLLARQTVGIDGSILQPTYEVISNHKIPVAGVVGVQEAA